LAAAADLYGRQVAAWDEDVRRRADVQLVLNPGERHETAGHRCRSMPSRSCGPTVRTPRPSEAAGADRRIAEALSASPNRLFADALLLGRATGLRVGELVTLELDCVHEVSGAGAWLKVPLAKLDSERMVPLDEEALAIVGRIAEMRSPGRPLPHPKTGQLAEFLLTHHGKRVSTQALRDELARVGPRSRPRPRHAAPAPSHSLCLVSVLRLTVE
jgi:integrase